MNMKKMYLIETGEPGEYHLFDAPLEYQSAIALEDLGVKVDGEEIEGHFLSDEGVTGLFKCSDSGQWIRVYGSRTSGEWIDDPFSDEKLYANQEKCLSCRGRDKNQA